jgi:hypothetical protein
MSSLELYYHSRIEHYLAKGMDEEEAEFEAMGDYYKNYSSIKGLFVNK